MHDFVSIIIALVKADITAGRPVNIDVCCRHLRTLYPTEDQRKLKDAVLEVVSTLGGAAEWGTEPPD
jgi:hypothetical protein